MRSNIYFEFQTRKISREKYWLMWSRWSHWYFYAWV